MDGQEGASAKIVLDVSSALDAAPLALWVARLKAVVVPVAVPSPGEDSQLNMKLSAGRCCLTVSVVPPLHPQVGGHRLSSLRLAAVSCVAWIGPLWPGWQCRHPAPGVAELGCPLLGGSTDW